MEVMKGEGPKQRLMRGRHACLLGILLGGFVAELISLVHTNLLLAAVSNWQTTGCNCCPASTLDAAW